MGWFGWPFLLSFKGFLWVSLGSREGLDLDSTSEQKLQKTLSKPVLLWGLLNCLYLTLHYDSPSVSLENTWLSNWKRQIQKLGFA